jgi:uncharacterized protein YxjI
LEAEDSVPSPLLLTVATVSKRWVAWADTYGVDIAAGEDDVLILASTVVIDMICHGEKKR